MSSSADIQQVQEVIGDIGYYFHIINVVLSFVSVLMNTFHIFILSQKSMRTSSTNVILISLSVCDIAGGLTTIYKHFLMVDAENSECVTSTSLWKIYFDITLWSIIIHFRRCASWLGIFMATVRLVLVKKLSISRFCNWSKPRVGWLMAVILFFLSALLSVFYQFRFVVIENRSFPLPQVCAQYQNTNNVPKFSVALSPLFSNNDRIVLRAYLLFDIIVSKFLPCIAFALLTIFLIRVLKNVKKSTSSARFIKENKTDLSTKLIGYMTVGFFITGTPLGIIYLTKAFFDKSEAVVILSTDLALYFLVLVTINAILHPIFCILMSSRYRDTIRKTFLPSQKSTISVTRNAGSMHTVSGIRIN
ncbi:G-protein coupled receptors family 1 profile domain-containing protein [Caenorhabditis elegans]|uniref:G-protein coupled receptors family 1 profile domain-containing protein n=1 Tax=Caenorhabditis elegans TaxID=6239 RepID=A0A0K3AT19_CAEEL|nr:G-protein coupled receptors family 1 profile domain-containing protein [Caenorhabditis elegans]CTQ86954.1 G-protein coupled receptors family 1 profile domain-containing protein [Caenorhabditis elegans]|eukprot:NP_001300255.1 Serpentine Receptor, class W [Caenorhabditis elegans]